MLYWKNKQEDYWGTSLSLSALASFFSFFLGFILFFKPLISQTKHSLHGRIFPCSLLLPHDHAALFMYIIIHPCNSTEWQKLFYFTEGPEVFLFVLFCFVFRERGREGETEGEKHQSSLKSGTEPSTLACALTRN